MRILHFEHPRKFSPRKRLTIRKRGPFTIRSPSIIWRWHRQSRHIVVELVDATRAVANMSEPVGRISGVMGFSRVSGPAFHPKRTLRPLNSCRISSREWVRRRYKPNGR